jgi:GrpB-like predicted nucleotidyltransferase (UPF0157 family)
MTTGRVRASIEIVPYRPQWPAEFLRLGRELRSALKSGALRIDHIGSTAVPGLPAKDVIDLQVTVPALAAEVEQVVQELGYVRRPNLADHVPPGETGGADDWAKWVFREPPNQRRMNLHLRVWGRPNQRYPLLFRDYLRAHPAAAEAYGRAKVALACLHPKDMDAYTDVKDPICDLILQAAEAWAMCVSWEPGATDC